MTVGQLREKLATRMSVPAAEVGLFVRFQIQLLYCNT
jgi:hypothetical protein